MLLRSRLRFNLQFGPLAGGHVSSFLPGVRTEAVEGFGVARHQKESPARAFVYQDLGSRQRAWVIPEHRAPRLGRGGSRPVSFPKPGKVNGVWGSLLLLLPFLE